MVAKALAATGTKVDTFVGLISEGAKPVVHSVPVIGFAQAGIGGYFDDAGFPVGKGWDEVTLPTISDEHAYALEISGDSMKPVYRDGDIIVVSPEAPVRRGDRVVVRTKDGEVTVKELKRRTSKQIELKALNSEHRDRTLGDVRHPMDRPRAVGEPVARGSAEHAVILRVSAGNAGEKIKALPSHRHARPCAGHPRLTALKQARRGWPGRARP